MTEGWTVADLRGGTARYRARIGTGLYAQVVDVLGQEIIDGDIPVGTILHADQLCERLSVSRSVVREGMRTLGSMGLLEARPQVGTRVLPPSNWDLLNPYVVKWRGQGPGYIDQMKELLELRLGLEHAAAGLSAARLSPELAQEMLRHALVMRESYRNGDTRTFFESDETFHRLMLEGTQNAVIAQLADTIGVTLHLRGQDTRPGMVDMTAEAVESHVRLAEALVARDAERAQAWALELVELTLAEFEQTHTRVRAQ